VLVVFDEIPSRRREPLSQGQAIFYLAAYFAVFLVGSAIAWFRWSGYPLSVSRKISLGEFVLGSLISGVFLLTAKSATPQTNQKRLWVLVIAMLLVQLILDVLR
jgi:formate hydrogenlyase subunit 4